MNERKGIVTHRGNPMTLLGPELKIGQNAPPFAGRTGFAPDKTVTLEHSKGKIRVISVSPSLDTSTCERQAIRFEEEASKATDDIQIIQMSMDLPPAQGRFCKAQLHGSQKSIMLSDYADKSFGLNYGFLLKEWQVHSRGIVIIGKDDTVKYVEYCAKIEELPDFDKALEVVKSLK